MAREIDLSKPLSDEDRQYLVDRCAWSRIAQADQIAADQAQAKAVEDNKIENPQPSPTRTGAAALAEAANASPGDDGGEEELPYEEWSFEDLKVELDRRKQLELNGGMSTEEANKLFSKGGSQKDLVARLYADDERYEEND